MRITQYFTVVQKNKSLKNDFINITNALNDFNFKPDIIYRVHFSYIFAPTIIMYFLRFYIKNVKSKQAFVRYLSNSLNTTYFTSYKYKILSVDYPRTNIFLIKISYKI